MPEHGDQLITVFENGELFNQVSFEEVRDRAAVNKEIMVY